jgi:uncharacterized membrane protein
VSFGTVSGFSVSAVGAVMIIAPLILPRAAFGELGHGDGMGLIGMIMMGFAVFVTGLIVAGIAAWLGSRTPSTDQAETSNAEGVETK